jgi:hypothetical protein
MADEAYEAARDLARKAEMLTEAEAAIASATTELHAAQTVFGGKLSEVATSAAALVAMLKPVEPPPPPPPPPGKVGWGRGPVSGQPWWSGVRYPTAGLPKLNPWIKAARPGIECDIFQMFVGPEQAQTWIEVAGGPDDGITNLKGQLAFREGVSSARFIWTDFPSTRAVMTIRPIPEEQSNKNGKDPSGWIATANGERDWVWNRFGGKVAQLDEKYPRKQPIVFEIGHEFTGSWYWHSIDGCWKHFPAAWAKIVNGIRKGYRSVSGKDCPHLFWLRGSREHVEGAVTEDWLPSAETWDGIGLSQHDNHWSAVTPADPRLNWRRTAKCEGLENIAEIADKARRPMGFWEWSSHLPGAQWNSGPHPDVFTQSMFDFFMAAAKAGLMAGETYFLNDGTTMVGNPDWPGTVAYRATFGTKQP